MEVNDVEDDEVKEEDDDVETGGVEEEEEEEDDNWGGGRTPRLGPALCASLRSRHARGHFTRATMCKIYR